MITTLHKLQDKIGHFIAIAEAIEKFKITSNKLADIVQGLNGVSPALLAMGALPSTDPIEQVKVNREEIESLIGEAHGYLAFITNSTVTGLLDINDISTLIELNKTIKSEFIEVGIQTSVDAFDRLVDFIRKIE